MIRNSLFLSVGAASILTAVSLAQPAAARAQYTTIDPPGSTATRCVAINEAGAIAGYYVDGAERVHGFVRTPDGAITSFDPPHAKYTEALAIDRAGAVTGFFEYRDNLHGTDGYGFIRHADGVITTFAPGFGHIRSVGINDSGAVAGNSWEHGFVRSGGGHVEKFSPPQSVGALVTNINNAGAVVGSYATYQNGDLLMLGFLRTADGAITSFGAPDAHNTWPIAIDAAGAVAGQFETPSGIVHGFLRATDGSFTSFDPKAANGTSPHAINAGGEIIGQYWVKSDNSQHGFIRSPDGAIKSFDPPESTGWTDPEGVNAKGLITGYYLAGGVSHGFLRTP